MEQTSDILALGTRDGLPEGLDALLRQHPREGWRAHPEFGELTRFWLERHLAFREMLSRLEADGRAAHANDLDPQVHAQRLSRLGGMFLEHLHGHHSIEDAVYFPKLVVHAPTLERGFEILDADHHRLHDELDAFANDANAVLRGGGPDAVGRLIDGLERMQAFLDRHLTDEEDLVVPVILEIGETRLG